MDIFEKYKEIKLRSDMEKIMFIKIKNVLY